MLSYSSCPTLLSIEIGTLTCTAVVTKPRNEWHWFSDWPAEGENTIQQAECLESFATAQQIFSKAVMGDHIAPEPVALGK